MSSINFAAAFMKAVKIVKIRSDSVRTFTTLDSLGSGVPFFALCVILYLFLQMTRNSFSFN